MAKTIITETAPGPLPLSFYESSTLVVAEKLLGMYLYRRHDNNLWAGKIVEVEAYIGEDDPACHAFRGLTPRTRVMYGPAGHAYVYFTYGMHWMLNVVTERAGFPAAVLIRALEPIYGFSGEDPRPASGPGKLCRSMRIDKTLNGVALNSSELWIAASDEAPAIPRIGWSTRIGIRVGTDQRWRAYIADNLFVSARKGGSVTRPETKRR